MPSTRTPPAANSAVFFFRSGGRADEWRLTGDEMIERRAERINIRAAVNIFLAFGLLGRYVMRRAERHASLRIKRLFAAADVLRQTHVENFRDAVVSAFAERRG